LLLLLGVAALGGPQFITHCLLLEMGLGYRECTRSQRLAGTKRYLLSGNTNQVAA
jgi:hypothetical protein